MFFKKWILLLYGKYLESPLIQRYYAGLAVQARYLYQQSELFKLRWQEMGLVFARDGFEQDGEYFFRKAQKEPLRIRLQILLDAFGKKESKPYYIQGER